MTELGKWPYTSFLAFGALVFILATLGSDVIARTRLSGDGLWQAASQHAHYAAVQLIGTALLLAPFLLLGWMSGSAATRKTFGAGLCVFFFGTLLLGFMYFVGYQDAETFAREGKWTAATLSVGMLPFKSAVPLMICLGVRWLVLRNSEPRPNNRLQRAGDE
jgi:hypothetical protein